MQPDLDAMNVLAKDLSKVKDQQATDLSAEAIAARDRARRMAEAVAWVRMMKRTFKGKLGCPTRKQYAEIAARKFGLIED